MFGFRSDGKRLTQIDPIVRLMPYIMPKRNDAQVMNPQEVDYEAMAAYIQQQRREGRVISFMSILIAAYVRVASQYPEVNRFVANKQLYARKEIVVCFNVLKRGGSTEFDETVVKLKFSPWETLFEMSERIEKAIEENRKSDERNDTDKLARFLLAVPGLPTMVIGLAKLLDRYGLLPRIIHEASPFHTSLYLTNLASLGVSWVYHHIYNFGTTSAFISMGKVVRVPRWGVEGTTVFRRVIPLGIVLDERICGGANYARAIALWRRLVENPTLLETPPDTVAWEIPGMEAPPRPD